jgi:hypothetical protein
MTQLFVYLHIIESGGLLLLKYSGYPATTGCEPVPVPFPRANLYDLYLARLRRLR